jgi:hypothetical protein
VAGISTANSNMDYTEVPPPSSGNITDPTVGLHFDTSMIGVRFRF